MARDLAPLAKHLLVQCYADGLASARGDRGGRRVPRFDRGDSGALARGREQQTVADLKTAAFNPAGDDAAMIEFEDVLNRIAQRQIDRRGTLRELIQNLDDGRP